MFKSNFAFKKRSGVIAIISFFFLALLLCSGYSYGGSHRWFPSQKAPKKVLKTIDLSKLGSEISDQFPDCPSPQNVMHILAQSVSGLVAKAVNNGHGNEMVWIERNSDDYRKWYSMTKQRLGFEEKGVYPVWWLVEHFKNKGIIKGYILYSYDNSKGGAYTDREDVDSSVNVATTVAGLKDAILVEENLEVMAKKLGLKKLFDARGKDMQWCYDNVKDSLNRNLLLTVDPKVGFNRAIAIANKCAAVYDVVEITRKFSEWVKPPSAVLGWNCGDESEQTGLVTEYGHFQTASNWALNLPLLSAGAEDAEIKKLNVIKPGQIDWDDERYPAAFIMSDGDNLQWMINDFSMSPSYWANPNLGSFAMGWTFCPGHLAQMSPATFNYMVKTRQKNAGFMEYGAGYYYPDLFADKRQDRLKYLEQHAERISHYMNLTGVKVFGFICKDVNSPEAMEAYEVYAKKLKDIYGIIAFQYYPYNAGKGKIYWFKNSDGIDIPVVTATHSMWVNARWQGGGTPAKVARLINEDSCETGFSLVAAHAWSRYKESPGPDEQAENITEETPKEERKNAKRGVDPIKWCVDRLDDDIQVVTPEELIWRIRMKYRPEQTRQLIK